MGQRYSIYLAQGDDEVLAQAARLDLAAQKTLMPVTGKIDKKKITQTMTAAAEAWDGLSANQPRGNPREACYARALWWHKRSVTDLDRTARAKTEKRIDELEKLLVHSPFKPTINYPFGASLLLTFEPETLSGSNTKISAVTDTSMHGLRATANGVTIEHGIYGTAAVFTGNGRIDCGNAEHLHLTGTMTCALWMYVERFDAPRNPWSKSYGGEGSLTLEPTGLFNYYYGTNGNDGEPYTTVGTTTPITPKVWFHCAVVRNFADQTITFYHNGVPTLTEKTIFPQTTASTQPLLIGDGSAGPFAGKIDDIGFWPRALSAQDIMDLYQATVPGR
jgi:Concanavalin A-like lectin/glucanases superfamily